MGAGDHGVVDPRRGRGGRAAARGDGAQPRTAAGDGRARSSDPRLLAVGADGIAGAIAAAALVGGVLCLANRRWIPAALLFAGSLLVRETGLIAIGCLLVAAVMSGRRWEPLAVGVCAVGAMALWRLYVAWVLFPDWGINGLLFHPPDVGWPFAGIVDLWRQVLQHQYYPGLPELSRAAIVFPLLLIAGLLVAAALVTMAPTATAVAALVYGLLAVRLQPAGDLGARGQRPARHLRALPHARARHADDSRIPATPAPGVDLVLVGRRRLRVRARLRCDGYQGGAAAVPRLVDAWDRRPACVRLAIGLAGGAMAQEPGVPADALIRLQRTSCSGPCPIYTVTIDARGTVTFEGEDRPRHRS